MSLNTVTYGIHQSDILIREAILAGIADLRKNIWLLDYCFASLPKDELTASKYGEKSVEFAKKWFKSNEISVVMNVKVDEPAYPCITIGLQDSIETKNNLADVHHQSAEDYDADWPILIGPFSPQSYDAEEGLVTISSSYVKEITPAIGMSLVDKSGQTYEILNVDSPTEFYIADGTVVDLEDATIRQRRPAYIVTLESAAFKETYSLGCHVVGEPVNAIYLHSILVFCLLRYREQYLEGRGFYDSSIASADLKKERDGKGEIITSRYMTITGMVYQYWPKERRQKIASIIPTVSPIAEDVEYVQNNDIEDWEEFENRDSLDLS